MFRPEPEISDTLGSAYCKAPFHTGHCGVLYRCLGRLGGVDRRTYVRMLNIPPPPVLSISSDTL
jgi:hypothetical protein